MPKIGWNGHIPRLARTVTKLLAEGPAKVSSGRKSDCEGDIYDLLAIGDVAERGMSRQKPTPLNVVMNAAVGLEHVIEAGTRDAEFPA
jgi:hypothetical protein